MRADFCRACLHDPETYPEPDRFMPERFLRDGELDPNVPDPGRFAFGYGRRRVSEMHNIAYIGSHSTLEYVPGDTLRRVPSSSTWRWSSMSSTSLHRWMRQGNRSTSSRRCRTNLCREWTVFLPTQSCLPLTKYYSDVRRTVAAPSPPVQPRQRH